MPAGYSGTPLIKKLGITPGMKILLVHPPADYYSLIGTNLDNQLCKAGETPALIHLFTSTMKEFEGR